MQLVVNWLELRRREVVLKNVSGNYLDIGCGMNRAVQDYRRRGGRAIGVDVFDFGGADLVVQNTASLDFHDRQFDTVSLIACLNHIPNRKDVLKEAWRVLAPGGKIVVTMITPHLSKVWHRVIRKWDEDQTERGMKEGELWGMTPSEVSDVLSNAGFVRLHHSRFVFGLNHLYLGWKN